MLLGLSRWRIPVICLKTVLLLDGGDEVGMVLSP